MAWDPSAAGEHDDDVERLRRAARELNDGARFRAAERVAARGLARAPTDADLHCQLGRSLIGQDRYAEARKALEESLALDGDRWFAHGLLGHVHIELGEDAEAESALANALRAHPRWTWALRELGRLHYRRNELAHAREKFDEVLAIDPNDGEAHGRLAYVHALRKRKRAALASARRAVELAPSSWLSHGALSYVLLQTGRPFAARRHAREALRLSPTDANLWTDWIATDRACRWIGLPAYYVKLLPLPRIDLGATLLFGIFVAVGFFARGSAQKKATVLTAVLAVYLGLLYLALADRIVTLWVRWFPPREDA
ncbi:MAG: tetratricopeptide repeat protein [Planctomycetes bacterium]|nr:tetratricopeptide repeat protein [Planctomycetota bacterium]